MTDILTVISIPLLILSYAAVGVYAVHLQDKLKRVEKQLEAAHFKKLHCETNHSTPTVDPLVPPEIAALLGVVAPAAPKPVSKAPSTTSNPSNDEIIEILKKSFKESRKNSGESGKSGKNQGTA
jgi:hypothetical protein